MITTDEIPLPGISFFEAGDRLGDGAAGHSARNDRYGLEPAAELRDSARFRRS